MYEKFFIAVRVSAAASNRVVFPVFAPTRILSVPGIKYTVVIGFASAEKGKFRSELREWSYWYRILSEAVFFTEKK